MVRVTHELRRAVPALAVGVSVLIDKVTPASTSWVSRLASYRQANNTRATIEIVFTVIPFIGMWLLMAKLATVSVWLTLVLSIPAAGLLVRLFMVQHDCGHNAMFTSRAINDWVGRVLGILTLTPYDLWRQSHAIHHAGSGNLDRRGIGDIDTLTLREYQALTMRGRFGYRLYRHPLVMFGLGPAYLFLLRNRFPVGAMSQGPMPWVSTMTTNLGIVVVSAALIKLVGLHTFLLIQLPLIALAAAIGVWLFYVQHQFERTYWEKNPDWSHPDAALNGSSFYDLPKPLMWLTGNIGIHHVHHLCSRIPFYRLPEVLRDHPQLAATSRLTLWRSLSCVRLTLWDEQRKQLVPFPRAA
jgi:omega-6 fatty acid desaturase (delta-12 desaturase)